MIFFRINNLFFFSFSFSPFPSPSSSRPSLRPRAPSPLTRRWWPAMRSRALRQRTCPSPSWSAWPSSAQPTTSTGSRPGTATAWRAWYPPRTSRNAGRRSSSILWRKLGLFLVRWEDRVVRCGADGGGLNEGLRWALAQRDSTCS